MKGHKSTILSIGAGLIACVTALTGAITLSSASAQTTTDTFITPDSYEQYLPLTEPSDVAISDNFVAIADQNNIHVYDKQEKVYHTYEHKKGTESVPVEKLQFSGNRLYFLDDASFLYALSPGTFTSPDGVKTESMGFSCSNFAINGNVFYFSTTIGQYSTLYKTSLDSFPCKTPEEMENVVSAENKVASNIVNTPPISLDGNALYYIDGGKTLRQPSVDTSWQLTDDPIFSIAVLHGLVYFTTATTSTGGGNDFYVYDLADKKILHSYEKEAGERGFSTLSVYDDKVYVVKNQSVCEYSPSAETFTAFEIGASSTSEHRLQQASDSVLFENKIFTADKGAKRVSIYDTVEKTYQTIENTIEGDFIATDGKTVLLAEAHASSAVLYDVATGQELLALTEEQLYSDIVGLTCVYGKYYYVTVGNRYGTIYQEPADAGAQWKYPSTPHKSTSTPLLLTSDVQGNLYVLVNTGNVYRLTEEEFLSGEKFGEALYSGLPMDATKLLVDYEQNVYALQGNELLKYTPAATSTATERYPLGKTMAYTQTENTPVTTITFGAEHPQAYVVYDDNLMISTLDLGLPCMENIPTEQVDESIFGEGVADFKVVKTAVKSLLVEFDLNTLSGADVFPYLDYLRAEKEFTALQIGETDKYVLLAIFHEDEHNYRTYLVNKRAGALTELAPEDYRKEYASNEQTDGWLSSSANLYKFPYLTELLTVNGAGTKLPKNQKVTLLGEIGQLDYDYYHVAYVDESGVTKTGYIPKSFINDFDGTPPTPSENIIGDGKTDVEAGWRFLYILLGCAAIIILVDFLILMPKNKKDD